MRKNTLFNFIASKNRTEMKRDKEGRSFAVIPLPHTSHPSSYQLKEHHFTIYAGDDEAHDSEFHYTANIVNERREEIKVHVFFNRHNKQTGNITFSRKTASGSEKIEMHDEATHLFFNQTAFSTMGKTILPIKLDLASEVMALDANYDHLVRKSEKQSSTNAGYLTGLQELKFLLDQLVPLVHDNHYHVAHHKMISSLIQKLKEEKIEEKDHVVAEGNMSPHDITPSAPVKEQTTPFIPDSPSHITIALKKAEVKRANKEIHQFVEKTQAAIAGGRQAVTVLEKRHASSYEMLSNLIKAIAKQIAEANGIFLLLSEHISLTNLMHLNVAYNELRVLGACLFQLCIQLPLTEQAKILSPFYGRITSEDLGIALERNHQSLIEFFIKDCHVPIEQWEVSVRGQSYPSTLHYLISEPNDEKIELLILLISNGISILSKDLSIIRPLLTSEDPKLQLVIKNPSVKSVTVCNRNFCTELTEMLGSESNSLVSTEERQRILAAVKRHERVSASEVKQQNEIASLGNDFEEKLKNYTTPVFETAFNSVSVKALREKTLLQLIHFISRLSPLSASFKQLALFNKACSLRMLIMYPSSDNVALYKINQIMKATDGEAQIRLFHLERRVLCALGEDLHAIEDKMITIYTYLYSVLKCYEGISKLQDRAKEAQELTTFRRNLGKITKQQAKEQQRQVEQGLTAGIIASEQEMSKLLAKRWRELSELKEPTVHATEESPLSHHSFA